MVRLSRGQVLRGRLLDSEGKGISGEWLLLVGNTHEVPVQYATRTDDTGHFRWNEAPSGDVYLAFGVDINKAARPEFRRLTISAKELEVRTASVRSPRPTGARRDVVYAVRRDGQSELPMPLDLVANVRDAVMKQLGGSRNQGSEEHQLLSISADRRSAYFFDIANDGSVHPSGKLELPGLGKSRKTPTPAQTNPDRAQNDVLPKPQH